MKRQLFITTLLVIALLMLVKGAGLAQEGDIHPLPDRTNGPDAATAAVDASFTYQGSLLDGGAPVNDTCDFIFTLWDAAIGGNNLGTNTRNGVLVEDGLFTVSLSFLPTHFKGDARWLAISVDCGSGLVALSPRQALKAAPYSLGLRPGAAIEADQTDPALTLANTDSYALQVSSENEDGIYVSSAGDDGVHVYEAGDDGVDVYSAADDGVHVYSAGSPSTSQSSAGHNGIEVQGAEGNGLFVGRADGSGAYVESAGNDGVHVGRAGSPSAAYPDGANNGIEVEGAEGNGLFIGRADGSGVYVNSAAYNGVYVYSAGNYAGYFNGDVQVTGTLSKGAGSFLIDHPLDPENKYLSHSFVESPDMMNVYNGNVLLDETGAAWVQLPEWFQVLNRDFRYQLTAIGAPGPNLYIAAKIEDNRFRIAGGEPGMEVSWQVTGIRQDPYARAHPIVVEEDKPEDERGTYLHPEAYGLPVSRGAAYREAQMHGGGQ